MSGKYYLAGILLTAAALAATVVAYPHLPDTPIYGQEKGSQSSEKEEASQAVPQPLPPSSNIVVIDKQTSEINKNGVQNRPESYLHRFFGAENVPNLGLLLAGIVGICVAIKTLKAIQRQGIIMIRQARIMQRQASTMEAQTGAIIIAANSAKASADIQNASQRAWLDGKLQPKTDDWGTYDLVIENHGSTPAQLLRYEYFYFQEGGEFRWDAYSQKTLRNWGVLLGAKPASETVEPITPRQFFDFLKAMGSPGTASCSIGVAITYQDIIDRKTEHVTRFLVVYNRVSKSLDRLSQYNEYS
jgi:hypothetical protein